MLNKERRSQINTLREVRIELEKQEEKRRVGIEWTTTTREGGKRGDRIAVKKKTGTDTDTTEDEKKFQKRL